MYQAPFLIGWLDWELNEARKKEMSETKQKQNKKLNENKWLFGDTSQMIWFVIFFGLLSLSLLCSLFERRLIQSKKVCASLAAGCATLEVDYNTKRLAIKFWCHAIFIWRESEKEQKSSVNVCVRVCVLTWCDCDADEYFAFLAYILFFFSFL